jgi:hypothetical protein
MKMNNYEKAMKLNPQDFKQLIGIKKQTFAEMLKILQEDYRKKHKRRGRKPKLSLEYMLMMTLKYLRQYVIRFVLKLESMKIALLFS